MKEKDGRRQAATTRQRVGQGEIKDKGKKKKRVHTMYW